MRSLTDYEERLVVLMTVVVLGRWDDLREVRLAAPPGEPDLGWREAVLQAHLFAGFPRVVEAFEVLEKAGGLGKAPDPVNVDPALGVRLFQRIYEEQADDVRATLKSYDADFASWIQSHAYSTVLGRPGLEPHTRELLAVAALAASAQTRQLVSHTLGAVRCGATPEQLHGVLDAIETRIAADAMRAARAVLNRYVPID